MNLEQNVSSFGNSGRNSRPCKCNQFLKHRTVKMVSRDFQSLLIDYCIVQA